MCGLIVSEINAMIRECAIPFVLAASVLSWSCASLREPAPESVQESYRIYWAPTFKTPDEFLVQKTADDHFLSRQKYRGMGGYSPVKSGRPRTKRISVDQWMKIRRHVEEGGFWEPRVKSGIASEYLDSMLLRLTGRLGSQTKEVTQYGEYDPVVYDLIELTWQMWPGRGE